MFFILLYHRFAGIYRKILIGSNEMAVMKILYLRTLDVVKKWTMPYPNWSLIRGKLDFLWGMGWDL